MYKHILVPVNSSATSERALQEAIKLAGGEGLIRLIFVLEEIIPLGAEGFEHINSEALQKVARKEAEKMLAEAAEKVQQSGAAVEIALLDDLGQGVVDAINNEAQNCSADLIVIGTHGRTGLSRLLLGSVAEGVVRESSIPVLLIRA